MTINEPQSFSLKQFALVQYTANMLLTCTRRVSESIGEVDQADAVVVIRLPGREEA